MLVLIILNFRINPHVHADLSEIETKPHVRADHSEFETIPMLVLIILNFRTNPHVGADHPELLHILGSQVEPQSSGEDLGLPPFQLNRENNT